MSGIKRYLSDNAYKAAEHSESPSESNPFVTLHKAIAMRSDWNENDTTQYDYILNRTHYIDYIPTDYEAEEATFAEAGGYAHGSIYGYSSGHSLYPEGFTVALAEGMPFKFVIGDTTYEGIGHRPPGNMFYAGNRHIYNNVFPDTGESWCVYSGMLGMATLDFYIDSSYIGTTQNIVPTTYSEVVHQLPTKFINSDLATKENIANKKTSLDENSDTYYPTQKAVKTAVNAKADKVSNAVAGNLAGLDSNGNLTDSGRDLSSLANDSSVVHNTGAEIVSGVKTFSNGLINGSLFFGSPITPISLSGNATWTINDLKTMMKVVLSGSTNTITLPNGGENPFRFQIIVAQDGTGSRALTISGASGVNVYNPSEFDFSSGSANQICVCTIIWDGIEYIYECINYVGGE